jgi:HK97 gp10 family phage protein
MAMTVSVTRTSRIPAVTAAVLAKAALVVTKAAMDIEAHAKDRAPVDTGFLKNSIAAKKVGALSWEVEVHASYGVFQEMGTRFQPARPYFIPAIELVRPSYLAAMRTVV